MNTISKFLVISVASAVLGTSAYSADRVLKRIDHPNGPDTYAYVPADRADSFGDDNVTIARIHDRYEPDRVVIARDGGFIEPWDADLRTYRYGGRREVIVIPAERW